MKGSSLLWVLGCCTAALIIAVALVNQIFFGRGAADIPDVPRNSVAAELSNRLSDQLESSQVKSLSINLRKAITDQILLSSGEEIRVRWRATPVDRIDVSPPYADDYTRLREMAENGNAAAGFTLWQILDSCEFGYASREPFEAAMNMLNETYTLVVPGRKEPTQLTNISAAEGWQKVLPILYEQCQGITTEQKSQAIDWLEQAAGSEHVLAMMNLSENIDDFGRGVELDQARWNAGDAGALRDLAIRYYASYDSGQYPENKTKFYAAIYAYSQIALIRYSNDQDRAIGSRYDHVKHELQVATKELLPRERAEAIAIAENILRTNQNCCFDF